MKDYVFFYYAGRKPESPEEGQKGQERFWAWIKSLGDSVVNPGTPLGPAKTVGSGKVCDPAGTVGLTGFSIIKAPNMEEAVRIAQDSPFLEMGTIEVCEALKM